MKRSIQPRPVKPVSGVCRWLQRPISGSAVHRPVNGLLLICTDTVDTVYEVECKGGYTLTKRNGTSYELPRDCSTCTCPDATHRGRECKHQKALKAALAAIGRKVQPAPVVTVPSVYELMMHDSRPASCWAGD